MGLPSHVEVELKGFLSSPFFVWFHNGQEILFLPHDLNNTALLFSNRMATF